MIEISNIRFQTRYTLHAVCVHEGTVNLGHFWTYVYHSEREKWYRYNDNEGKRSLFFPINELMDPFVYFSM